MCERSFIVAIRYCGFAIGGAVGGGDLHRAKALPPTGCDLRMNPGAGLVKLGWLFSRELCGLILHGGLLSPISESAEADNAALAALQPGAILAHLKESSRFTQAVVTRNLDHIHKEH